MPFDIYDNATQDLIGTEVPMDTVPVVGDQVNVRWPVSGNTMFIKALLCGGNVARVEDGGLYLDDVMMTWERTDGIPVSYEPEVDP